MIQIPNLAKSFLLSGCGALAAWAVFTLPDNARASARAPSVVTLPGRSFSRQELNTARDRLLAVNDAFVEIGAAIQNPRIAELSTEARANILTMDDKNLGALALCEPQLVRMQAAAETMRSTIMSARTSAVAPATASTDGCPDPSISEFPCTTPCPEYAGFTPLGCIGIQALQESLHLVEWSGQIICDVFGQTVVVLGEGGNSNAACAIPHLVTEEAKIVAVIFTETVDEYAGAEAHATYLRQLPMYNHIVAVDNAVSGPSGLAGKLDALAAKVDALQTSQCETLRLLCLPQAWRHSEISQCEGQPGFPYHQ